MESLKTNTQRRRAKLLFFICSMFLYIAYNLLWLIGLSFSFGKNDAWTEVLYFVLTFFADIPIFFVFALGANTK